MAKTLKCIDAGGIQIEALYNRCSVSDTPIQRQAKHQTSSAAQRRMNQIYSYQKLELTLAVNFPRAGSALVMVLTFDDAHMPKSRKEAQCRFKYFLKRLRETYRAAGLPEPVVFWAPECLTSATGRWHFHVVMTNSGRDLDLVRSCWIYGSEIEADKLRVDAKKNHETLARYMTKELRECQEYDARPGLHGWSCTRNAKKPEVWTITVPDDYELIPPAGCAVLLDESKTTEFASYHVIKYRFGAGTIAPAPYAPRRRKRRE